MKKEIAEAWVADLRTNPPQATGQLYDGNGHCCLGRLCLVLGATFHESDTLNEFDDEYALHPILNGQTLGENEVLPNEIREMAGMSSTTGLYPADSEYRITTELTALNDNGATFAKIADIIEKNWESL